MRFLLMLIIGLAVGGAMLFVFTEQQKAVKENVNVMQNSAQKAADEYKKNQADMMKKLEQ